MIYERNIINKMDQYILDCNISDNAPQRLVLS